MNLSEPLGLLRLVLLALVVAMLPLGWWWVRHGQADARSRYAALLTLTAFLTFDLIVFGAFTRLTDSGLGCPDWPGCYGMASPVGAAAPISAAQAAQPTGPVTLSKAWIEMIHRYLAMVVGALILVLCAAASRHRGRIGMHPGWAWFTLAWVLVQGLFGKYTVTLKLQPAIVTLHLLGGMFLLALLVGQRAALSRPAAVLEDHTKRQRMRAWALASLMALAVQMALGAWVSSNYAVLACKGFPACNGQWWPDMDFANGFSLVRDLGRTGAGQFLPVQALVAIHVVHRLFAVVVLALGLALAWRLWRIAATRQQGLVLAALLALQLLTGLSNVVLDWPLVAALLHTAGAGLLVALLVLTWVQSGAWVRPSSGLAAANLKSPPSP